MATFPAVNSSLSENGNVEKQTPTTPEPAESRTELHSRSSNADESSPRTPTRHSFGGVLGQRPLPNELPRASHVHDLLEPVTPAKREESHSHRVEGIHHESHDVEMGEGDDEEHENENENEDDASDNESMNSDSQRPSKKKKGQRFFCTDFPPCTLSFTRSEHLARHIRSVLSMSIEMVSKLTLFQQTYR